MSWAAANGFVGTAYGRIASAAALIVGFFKARLILLDFMGLREGPLLARAFVEAWSVAACLLLASMYWLARP